MASLEDILTPKKLLTPNVIGAEPADQPLFYWWRVTSSHWWTSDGRPHITVHFHREYIVRATPKCVILSPWQKPRIWESKTNKRVLKQARKRFAYPTKKEAWESWCIRQSHRLQHAKNALEVAEAAHKFAVENRESLFD